jgi:hypothetical protein
MSEYTIEAVLLAFAAPVILSGGRGLVPDDGDPPRPDPGAGRRRRRHVGAVEVLGVITAISTIDPPAASPYPGRRDSAWPLPGPGPRRAARHAFARWVYSVTREIAGSSPAERTVATVTVAGDLEVSTMKPKAPKTPNYHPTLFPPRWHPDLFHAWYTSVIDYEVPQAKSDAARAWWERVALHYRPLAGEELLDP